jgi:putative transposase
MSSRSSLNGCYAQWWNRRHETVGHVFQGRFKDQIVEHEGYLLALCRYIALNPTRAGLVEEPADWRWSSYAATIGLTPLHPALSASAVLRQFGGDTAEPLATLQQRYSTFVTSASSHPCTDERIRSRERILGSSTFKNAIRAQLREREIQGVDAVPPVGAALTSDPGLTPA